MSYVIVMDVSGDVDATYAKEMGLEFLPMEYSLGEEMRTCTEMEDRELLHRFYDGQRNGDMTKTTQISPYMYEEYLDKYFKEGNSVLYLCLSSGLSSTFQSANIAKEELEEKYPGQKFYPVDSLAATGGMGVLIERALRNREKGMDIEANYLDLLSATKKIRHWFVVQDLMYLKRGGRVSAATAVVGSALNIKPILKIDETGHLQTIAKKRGEKAASGGLMEYFEEHFDASADDVIYVLDADYPDAADGLAEKIHELYPNVTIRRTGLSPIIGAHTGPGMYAICHMGK